MVKFKFTTDFTGAVNGKALRAHDEGVLRTRTDTTNVEIKDGGRRELTRIDTLFARPFIMESKDQSGKPCIIGTMTYTKQ